MYYTLSDFYNTFQDKVTLLCGSGGLSQRITSAGVVDYEFVPELKGKYRYTAFRRNELEVTSLLYAKDNPYLVEDTIKQLISAGTSGLVIKNVFDIKLRDTILRYADAKNYPIFITDAPDFFFEDFLYEVRAGAVRLASIDDTKVEMDCIMAERNDPAAVRQHVRLLNPSLENQHYVIYIPMERFSEEFSDAAYITRYIGGELDSPQTMLGLDGNGMFFMVTWQQVEQFSQEDIKRRLWQEVLATDAPVPAGISQVHHVIEDLGHAMIEAAFAAAYAEYFQIQDYVRFDDLGAYSVLLPFCRTRTMRDFSDRVLEPVIVYDMENKSHLEETLSAYCENRHDLHRAAEAMGQHANTIRYRLQRISDLSGRDYRDPLQMEELDMAYRIRRSWEILDMLGLPETVRRP